MQRNPGQNRGHRITRRERHELVILACLQMIDAQCTKPDTQFHPPDCVELLRMHLDF